MPPDNMRLEPCGRTRCLCYGSAHMPCRECGQCRCVECLDGENGARHGHCPRCRQDGYGGNHNTWLSKTCPVLPSLADSLGIIFVCPDGRNSWYIDSPVDTASCYETFITNELVAFVDSAYATIPHRHARAICGYSMGGHGALWCSLRHSGVWRAAYCISGCVDLTAYPGRWEIDRVLGVYAGHQAQWRAHSVVNLDAAAAGVDISLDCGSEDVFVNDNRRLHRRLSALGVPHRYTEMSGGHTHDYWRAALMRALDYLSPLLQRED